MIVATKEHPFMIVERSETIFDSIFDKKIPPKLIEIGGILEENLKN